MRRPAKEDGERATVTLIPTGTPISWGSEKMPFMKLENEPPGG